MKTETKVTHTPGPWETYAYESIAPLKVWADVETPRGEVRQVIAEVGGTYNHLDVSVEGEGNARVQADARLIAAAPELLEAVRAGKKAVKLLIAALEAADNVGLAGSEWLEFRRLAEAAIAKAEGGK